MDAPFSPNKPLKDLFTETEISVFGCDANHTTRRAQAVSRRHAAALTG
jgi:hypothetical protein